VDDHGNEFHGRKKFDKIFPVKIIEKSKQ